jgi:branched-chain amino acid transport system substrate-binding protein
MVPAADYSAAMHYLKSIAAAGTDGAPIVMAKMKATPVNDFFAQWPHQARWPPCA